MFSKNRDQLLEGDIAAKFLNAILTQSKVRKPLSTDHYSLDRTLIEAWASMRSFNPKGGSDDAPVSSDGGSNREAYLYGQKRSSDINDSTTDRDARLY